MNDETLLKNIFSWLRANSSGKLTQAQVDSANATIEKVGVETFAKAIGFDLNSYLERSIPKERNATSGYLDISERGFDLIKKFEGLKLKAYKDSAGIWTIGYGTIRYPNGKPVRQGDTCTQAQANEYMKHDCRWVEATLDKHIKNARLNQNQFDALASFVYNVGENAFAKSTMLSLINKNNLTSAASQFDRWVNAGGRRIQGLVNRRNSEKALFLSKA